LQNVVFPYRKAFTGASKSMSELASTGWWHGTPINSPSPYARMIPGTTALPRAHRVPTACASTVSATALGDRPKSETASRQTRLAAPQTEARPQAAIESFRLGQMVAFDLIALTMACGLLCLFIPAWSLPWTYTPIFSVVVTLFAFTQGLYRHDCDPFPAETVSVLTRSILLAIALVFIASWSEIRLLGVSATSVGSLATLVLSRRVRLWARSAPSRQTESRNVLMVGGGSISRSIAATLRNDPLHRATVCGFVDDELPLSPTVLGRIDDLEWLARSKFIDEVILTLPDEPALARRAAEVALRNHLDIRAVPDLPPGHWPNAGIDHIGEIPVITLHRELLPSTALFLKRLVDVTGALLGLVVASPLMGIVALLIRFESAGPVIYAAERTGAKGHRFRCYKFRSMVTDAEHLKEKLRARNQRQGPIFKIDDDPRVTRVGRLIRRYSLDELPQLWNVLRGEMSLVGPRPHPIDEVSHYDLQHYRRLDVKPGITGLWQITARDCPSFDLNMHLDLTYIENWTLLLDLRILASTVRVLFAPEGA
jgi:exopolysaccharide biosynthesis polyprenyl glycosylphosphotransferase